MDIHIIQPWLLSNILHAKGSHEALQKWACRS